MQPLLILNTATSVEVMSRMCSPTTYVTSQLLPAVAEVLSGQLRQDVKPSDIGALITLAGHGEAAPSMHHLDPVFIQLQLPRSAYAPSGPHGVAELLKRKVMSLELFQLKASGKPPKIRVRVTLVDGDEA